MISGETNGYGERGKKGRKRRRRWRISQHGGRIVFLFLLAPLEGHRGEKKKKKKEKRRGGRGRERTAYFQVKGYIFLDLDQKK